MNRFERRPSAQEEAQLEFLDGDFKVVRPGAYVRCAVTGNPIPLDDLRYWNVDRQQAYSGPAAKLTALASEPQ